LQLLHANQTDELEKHLALFGEDFLFRGQTKAYNLPDGSPNLSTSFQRLGCLPPLMLKWIFFTEELLRRGGVAEQRQDQLFLTQGLLQHYGWRSSFIDLSSSKAVAAWFASHAFSARPHLELCENGSENAVWLKSLSASYSDHDETGYFYVLSKDHLEAAGHSLVSLEEDLTTECPSRFLAQRAWLASVFNGQSRIDPAAITALITAPATVFAGLAHAAKIKETNDLFPGPDVDGLLGNLLDLPWLEMQIPNPMFPTYRRSLEIPEYQESYVKHLPATTALYSAFWLSESQQSKPEVVWIQVPEETFYGHTEIGLPLPRLAEYLRQNEVVHIESEGLICYPAVPNNTTYDKGISIRRGADNVFDVCAIKVGHPSERFTGWGVFDGYKYRLVGDCLVRHPSPTDCPCGDPKRHEYHLRAMAVLDDVLANARIDRKDQIIRVSWPIAREQRRPLR